MPVLLGSARQGDGSPARICEVFYFSNLFKDPIQDMRTLIVLAAMAATIAAHGGLTFPPPRNNHGNVNPFDFTPIKGSALSASSP